ncbi:MAG TPA: non-ribosomal peptide synthetase, partial [Steroidobacteraceae bacterium]
PTGRLELMLNDARLGILLTNSVLRGRFGSLPGCWLDVGAGGHEATDGIADPGPRVQPEDLAYVMYTSGSTGIPKGVMVTHAGLANYLTWAVETYEVASARGAAVHSSFGFDATLTGLLCPLLAGREVLLLPAESAMEALAGQLRGPQTLSLVKLTPAHLEILKSYFPPGSPPVAARAFVVGGEALVTTTVDYWREHSPLTRIFNEYGPTETVVGCCAHEVTGEDVGDANIPIGRPIAHTRMYVLDAHQQPVPVGVVGEIYIGGIGVARGYMNRPGLTAERFLPDRFGVEPRARMYRTGDLGCWRANGELQYLGRNDLQIKIRGYRVELGEVEAALLALPVVQAAAVTAHLGTNGDRQMTAHVVCTGPVSPSALSAVLERRLPQYMLPARWNFVSAIPLTANGKVDRRALEASPLLAGERNGAVQRSTPARGRVQEIIAAVWKEVLGIPEVGIHDNFFDIGGHSMLVARAHQRLSERLDSRLTLLDLYQHPTIHALERHITQSTGSEGAELMALRDRARQRRNGPDRRRDRP